VSGLESAPDVLTKASGKEFPFRAGEEVGLVRQGIIGHMVLYGKALRGKKRQGFEAAWEKKKGFGRVDKVCG